MSIFDVSRSFHRSVGECTELKDNIFKCKTFSEEYCRDIVDTCEQLSDEFTISCPGKPYTVDHLRLEYFGTLFCRQFATVLNDYIINSITSFYKIPQRPAFSLLDPYIARYSKDTIVDIKEHCDLSTFSIITKLNDDYDGGELIFPKLDYMCYNIEVGDSIIFPGSYLYPHMTKPVTSGKKYSLVSFLVQSELLNVQYCNHF